jgi:hypothetical protein
VRQVHHPRRRERAYVVTEARPAMSDDIAYRQRRYLIMMGIRALCFIVAIVLFVNHAGWLTAIPAVGAIIIPYFAVVFANGGREPHVNRGFTAYEPNLPVRHTGLRGGPTEPGQDSADSGFPADRDTPGASGAPRA